MPTYIRPARVIIDEGGGSGAAAIAAVAALAVIASSLAAIVADIVTALAIITAVAIAASGAVLAIVLRRHGVALLQRPPAPGRVPVPRPAARTPQAISAPQPRAIEAPRRRAIEASPVSGRPARSDRSALARGAAGTTPTGIPRPGMTHTGDPIPSAAPRGPGRSRTASTPP